MNAYKSVRNFFVNFRTLDVRSLAVASRSRVRKVAEYSRIGAYRTCTYGKEFLCEQNSGEVSQTRERIAFTLIGLTQKTRIFNKCDIFNGIVLI